MPAAEARQNLVAAMDQFLQARDFHCALALMTVAPEFRASGDQNTVDRRTVPSSPPRHSNPDGLGLTGIVPDWHCCLKMRALPCVARSGSTDQNRKAIARSIQLRSQVGSFDRAG